MTPPLRALNSTYSYKYLNPRYKTKSPLGIRKPFKKKHCKMKTFIIFSCFITMAFSACFTPNNFDCRRVTGTFPDPRDCGQSFVQVSTYGSQGAEMNWKVQFNSKVRFFDELWTELSSLFGQMNLNWSLVHFFSELEWKWTEVLGFFLVIKTKENTSYL